MSFFGRGKHEANSARPAKLHENEELVLHHQELPKPPKEARPSQPISAAMFCCSLLGAVAMFSNVMFRDEIDAIKEWVPANTTTMTTTTVTTATTTTSTSFITRTFTTTPLSDEALRANLNARKEARVFACGKGSAEACDLPIMGVNIGGWLVLEDDLMPGQMKDQGIFDEKSFIKALGGPSSPDAVEAMKEHWETFITDKDLDELKRLGITHVRVPVGYWLVDYKESDGFVYRGQLYLFRFLAWLRERGMKAVIVLQAVPGGQKEGTSSTGSRTWEPGFFLNKELYERGKSVMHKLAEWIVQMNENKLTEGTIVGLELLNEPDWQYWSRSPGIRELYETMVPKLRKLLPPEDCALLLNFQEPVLNEGLNWLAEMRKKNPEDYTSVFYDAHISHADTRGDSWHTDASSCKTCCRDPLLLKPLETAGVPYIIGEYSLDPGLQKSPDAWRRNVEYFGNQLSLWATRPGVVGSFFWNHRVLRAASSTGSSATVPADMSPLSLLDLIKPGAPLSHPWSAARNKTSRMEVIAAGLCPDADVKLCPEFDLQSVGWADECQWLTMDALREDGIVHT